ncbi:hypothetical protein [Pseudomonas denitrificans (nom. rej.)]|uniref:Uncharacterized protein n=1 Tax=Pseudomonas denitrificans TaxID=43306 RepID=A0A9X7N136_PSEDE|nr:hypothetical protein [Pseudomonas denitrificans (nom. rej.)]QEY73083.1 hypothetical protein F1C79_16565 [Pseudomonas denitrificans (nom. rej.)]
MKMTLPEVIEYFNGGIENAETLRRMAMSSNLQLEQCHALDLLQINAARFKHEAIRRAEEDCANLFLAYECAIGAVRSELLMFLLLKRDMPNKAWEQLVAAQMGCIDASRAHSGFDHCQQRLEDLIQYEELLFPPQVFMSAGFISDSLECSICGNPYAKCPHLHGRPYMGRFCQIIHRNPRGDHVALVDSPADKRCRVTSIQVREGHRDKLSGEITPYEGGELFDEYGPLNAQSIFMALDRYPYMALTGKVLAE